MTTQLDYAVGIGKESTYGTAVTPNRFFETEGKLKGGPETTQGSGWRPSKRVNRASRNTVSRVSVSGDTELEATTSGLGFLLNAALGASSSALAVTGVYQQLHTLRATDPVDSFTIQEQIPLLGGGAVQPLTFTGCVVDSIEFDVKEGAAVKVKLSWMGRDVATNITAAAASYPTGDDLFTFVGGSIGLSGTLTEPTSTAKASLSGSPAANIRDVNIKVANGLDTNGYNLGGAGKRSRRNAVGKAPVTGKLTAEYDSNVLRDAYLAQTLLPLVLTFLGPTPIVAGEYPTLQIVLPAIRLKGELPTTNGGDVVTQSIDFEAFDATASQPIWVVYRTADTAI